MITTSAGTLAMYAEKYGWLLIKKASKEDLELRDDYLVYLTPQGREVVIQYYEDGKVSSIITR